MIKVVLIANEPVDHAIAYANGLAGQADVVLIAPRRLYDGLTQWIDRRVTLRLVDWPRTRSARNPGFLWSLVRRVRKERPDIVHLLSNTTLWLNAAVPFWRDLPLVVTVHDVDTHPGDRETARLPGWAARLMARQADGVVVHGEGLRGDAVDRLGLTAERVHILPHPAINRYAELARAEDLVRQPSPPGSFRIVIFGRMYAYKGLRDLLQAEALLAESLPGLTITIAGRGDNPLDLLHLMGRPAIYDIRHRFIPDREVAQIFTDTDLVVLPYREASQSGVLHVAAPFGRPVIVTDVGELRTTVEDHGLGLVVPPADPQALAAAILSLADDRGRLAALGSGSRTWAQGPTEPGTTGAASVAMYRRLIQKMKPTPRTDAPATSGTN